MEPLLRNIPSSADMTRGCLTTSVHMIRLTKINNASIVLNSDLIEFIEETPDTVITLTNNDRLVVRECMDEIISKVVDYRRMISGLAAAEAERRGQSHQTFKLGEDARGN